MATNDQSSQNFMNQMFDLQQQYLKNIAQAFQTGQPEEAEAPQSPFDQWWTHFPKSGQNGFDSFFKNLSEMGIGKMNNPFENMQKQAAQVQDMSNWFNTMNQQFSEWSKASNAINPAFEKMNEQFKQQFQNPLDMSGMPWMKGEFSPEGMVNPMNSSVLNLLQNIFTSEEQKKGKQLMDSLEKYQNATMKYNQLMAKVGIDSLNQLQEKMKQAEGKNLQEIFEWWMESSKDVFNREKLDEPYKNLQQELETLQDSLSGDFEDYRLSLIKNLGLVSRAEFDAMKLQIEMLKADLDELKGQKQATASQSTDSDKEDFTVLNGIGKKFNDKLHQQGINNLQQLASLSDDMLGNLDKDLQAKGRVLQDQWREQAEQFLNKMTGKS